MLKKLLKYDLKALFRFWWIAALVSLTLSLLAGFSWSLELLDRPIPDGVYMVTGLFRTLVIFSYIVMFILSVVVIFLRFYRNFFSDEGYLTFTLPVERHTLLNSKIISGMILYMATLLVICVGIFAIFAVAWHNYIFSSHFLENIRDFFTGGMDEYGVYFWIYILEILTAIFLGSLLILLLLYTCITFGSVIAKKGKVIASIGIFYGIWNIFSFLTVLLISLCIPSIEYWMDDLTKAQRHPVTALLLLCYILLEVTVCSFMYTLQYRMLKRKLNLS